PRSSRTMSSTHSSRGRTAGRCRRSRSSRRTSFRKSLEVMFERRLYYHIDWALLIAVLALCALGVIVINGTTADPTRGTSRMYLTQLYAIVIGLGVMVFMLTLDYRTFTDKSHLIYFGLIALLLYVMFFGQ